MNKKQSIGLCSLLLTSVIANAGVSGTVYQDLPLNGDATNIVVNTYGQKDSNEEGLAGITVTAYPGGETTTTLANGTWTLASNGKARIEFTNIPTHLKESAGESSVQFINDGETADLALYNPAQYVDSAKNSIAMTLQPNSDATNAVSLKTLDKNNIPEIANDVPVTQTGSIWGLAYDNSSETFYASAVVRRKAKIGNTGAGTAEDTGVIYQIKDGVATVFTTIEDTGIIPSNEDRNLNIQNPHDKLFNQVGRIGLGDIDISTDGTKLYTINLKTNSLVEINIKTKDQTAKKITNPFGAGCDEKDVTSWGIGQNSGKVYVGSVCTTNTTQGAYISEFDGSSFTPFHNIPLDMDGEHSLDTAHLSEGKTLAGNKRWGKWITDYNVLFDGTTRRVSLPAPILSDIIFDEDNNMIIGFADRTSFQTSTPDLSPKLTDATSYRYYSAGDIYKVCNTSKGYANEGNTTIGAECAQNDTQNGLSYPEFFNEEEWNEGRHKEIAMGGLAYLQGSKSLVSSAFDPTTDDYHDSGLIWMYTENGQKQAGKSMVATADDSSYNAKAGGIGDIEILTALAPTEIGNRVWFDENRDCVQDANESGIANVRINLYASNDCTGSAVETVTTDANGTYLFPVNAGTQYSVCINSIADQPALNDKNLTTCNSDGTTINDSDARLSGADAKIDVSPLTVGANDHSFDFGFTTPVVTPTPVTPTPVTPTPVTPTPEDNRTIDHEDGSCDCHSYEDSSPSLSVWSMMILISLTSFMAFLFRKELNQTIK